MTLYDHDKSYADDACPPGNPDRGLIAPARPLSAIRARGAQFSIELLLSLKRSRFAGVYNELACHTANRQGKACLGRATNSIGAKMREHIDSQWLPAIIVSDIDQKRLSGLATAAMERIPAVAEELLYELERASVVAACSIPPNVVRMGSTVVFKTDDGQQTRVALVFPGEADISQGKISVLTPVGAALIGLSEGQSIMWTTRDGRDRQLTVLKVEPTALPT